MNKCLCCKKEVKNKFCDVSCQNKHKLIENETKYNNNPKRCELCNKKIDYKNRINKFCSRSCAAKLNNKNSPKRKSKPKQCKNCSTVFESTASLFCNKKCKKIKRVVGDRTKGFQFENSKNWQTARTMIRKDACLNFEESLKEKKCNICGYDKHVEIAHIKAVSEFSNDTLISVINHIDNLIALCPNHHWEYDNKLISVNIAGSNRGLVHQSHKLAIPKGYVGSNPTPATK